MLKIKKNILILDRYTIHTKLEIKEYAKKCNINLIYVPSGATSKNQPLDVSINEPIKSIGRKLMKKMYVSNKQTESILKQSLNALIQAKKDIKSETIIKLFVLACKLECSI
jgi:DDE superfamily endonuclease.